MFQINQHSSSNWDQLDPTKENSSSVEIFKRQQLSFIRPEEIDVCIVHHPKGLK